MEDPPHDLFEDVWRRAQPSLATLLPPLNREEWFLLKATVKRASEQASSAVCSSAFVQARGYQAVAHNDLAAANTLHSVGQYALAVYHAQQAVEKATKALCIALGRSDEEMIRSSHRTPEPLLSLLADDFARQFMALASSLNDKSYRKMLRRARKFVNSDADGLERLRRLPFSRNPRGPAIRDFVDLTDRLATIPDSIVEAERRVKEALLACLPEYEAEIRRSCVPAASSAALHCYVFGIVTFAHEGTSRYPGGTLQPSDYGPNLGIVQALPCLLERISRTCCLVDRVISQLQESLPDETGKWTVSTLR